MAWCLVKRRNNFNCIRRNRTWRNFAIREVRRNFH